MLRDHGSTKRCLKIRGPKDHITMEISHSGSKAEVWGIPEILFCEILMYMWSFWAQEIQTVRTQVVKV